MKSYQLCLVYEITLTGLIQNCPLLQQNDTSLMMAALGGHTSVVAALIDAKADVNLVDDVRISYNPAHW
jgi:ankyrin repeat protein